MASVERTFTVTTPASLVIDYLTDFARTEEWDPATESTRRIDSGPIAPGARWHNTSKVFGKTSELVYTLRERDPNRLVFVGENDTVTTTDTITAHDTPRGTEITYHVDLDVHGIAAVGTPILKLGFEKLAHDTVRQMTEVLENLPVR